jgi:uncharacterized protein
MNSSNIQNLKPSEFNVLAESFFDGVFLAFNTFSGAMREVSEEQALCLAGLPQLRGAAVPSSVERAGLVVSELLADGFLVPTERDERQQIRQAYWNARRDTGDGNLSLTISPTVSCNFRCTYCFEQHPNRSFTEDDIQAAEALVRQRLGPGGQLSILWFGGEPLAQFPVLKRLYKRLLTVAEARGGSLTHSMISNGSLLDPEKVGWLADKALSSIQITIDGTEATHNARRPTAGRKGTFQGILANVSHASKYLPIQLRINVDRRNLAEVPNLLDELVRRGLHRRPEVAVYLGWVRGYTESARPDASGPQLSLSEFADATMRLRYELVRRNFASAMATSYPQRTDATLCTADNPNGFVLSPGRLAFRCWNEAADDYEQAPHRLSADGVVENGPDGARRSQWEKFNPFSHTECQSCIVQPLCRGGCPWVARDKPREGPGDCTTLKLNLHETLRFEHLVKATNAAAD